MMTYLDLFTTTDDRDQKELEETTLFEKDDKFDTNWANDDDALYTSQPGRIKRVTKASNETHTFFLRVKPNHFMFKQLKCIPPRNDFTITFTKAKTKLYLNSFEADEDDIPRLKIQNMHLLVKRQKLNPQDMNRIEMAIRNQPAKFPLKDRTELRYHNIPLGTVTYNANALFNGVSPTRVIVGFVKGSNFSGDYKKSAFNFEHCNVNDVWFEKNGRRVPTTGYESLHLGGDAYHSGSALYPYKCLKQLGERCVPPKILNISYKDFCDNGYTLFAFDFTSEKEAGDGESFSTVNTAPINLYVNFSKETPESINIVLYSMYDSCLFIDKNKNVTYNWI